MVQGLEGAENQSNRGQEAEQRSLLLPRRCQQTKLENDKVGERYTHGAAWKSKDEHVLLGLCLSQPLYSMETLWHSGSHICFTCRKSWVQTPVEPQNSLGTNYVLAAEHTCPMYKESSLNPQHLT